MTSQIRFSDEQLTAFLDGELEHVPADQIRDALEENAELQARLEGLRLEKQEIADAFEKLLDCAPAAPDLNLKEEVSASAGQLVPRHWMAAAMAACLVLGLGTGLLWPRKELGSWQSYAAAYHALYIDQTLNGIDRTPAAVAAELSQVSKIIGKDFDLQALSQFAQFDYKRAQILGFEGEPLLQIAFLSEGGVPIALCIFRSTGFDSDEVQSAELEGMSSASWTKDGYDYLLIGGREPSTIKSAAETFARQL